jgi:formylglycine-generating enzyme required for sulfatase activity
MARRENSKRGGVSARDEVEGAEHDAMQITKPAAMKFGTARSMGIACMSVVGGIVVACRASEHTPDAAASQASSPLDAQTEAATPSVPSAAVPREPITILVPGTTAALVMQPVPGGVVEIARADGTAESERVEVSTFFLATTETTWDMYDAFVFALDRGKNDDDPPDAYARPSKPYILMDRGFGHSGYPAISVSFRGATEFCRWLSAKTHRRFRLPTEAEWALACKLGEDSTSGIEDRAWCAENSEVEMRLVTHPVAKKRADALGLFDLLGNAAEWTSSAGGKGVARGGSFKDHAANLASTARRSDDRALNATDPQIPKSAWWLADGGFIGFRVVMESAEAVGEDVHGAPQGTAAPRPK